MTNGPAAGPTFLRGRRLYYGLVPPELPTADRRTGVHPAVDKLAAYGWRLLVIGAVVGGLLWLVGRLWVVSRTGKSRSSPIG
jgi:hypothetical protein